MKKLLIVMMALGLSGCLYINGAVTQRTLGRDHRTYLTVNCIMDQSYCYDEAKDVCHGNFTILSKDVRQIVVVCF